MNAIKLRSEMQDAVVEDLEMSYANGSIRGPIRLDALPSSEDPNLNPNSNPNSNPNLNPNSNPNSNPKSHGDAPMGKSTQIARPLVNEMQKQSENRIRRTKSVLITQCIQHDFIGIIGASHDSRLPNQLHVGKAMADRLRDPMTGMMSWANEMKKSGKLEIIHIRDWHDRELHADHLSRFGEHCIHDHAGARLAYDLQADESEFINAEGLDDLAETSLAQRLINMLRTSISLRVAVIGVWTDVKVSNLLRSLRDELGIEQLATSEDLTASPNEMNHINALKSLQQQGVRVMRYAPSTDKSMRTAKPYEQLQKWLVSD